MSTIQIVGIIFLIAIAIVCLPAFIAFVLAGIELILGLVVCCIFVSIILNLIISAIDAIFGTSIMASFNAEGDDEEVAYAFA